MTLPDWSPTRKPRRLGLWLPWAFAVFAALAWCSAWFVAREKVATGLDTLRANAVSAGWSVGWSRAQVTGFPFRLDVDLENAHARTPSGWGLAAPELKAEAFLLSPSHWIAFASRGATVQRRRGGALMVKAKSLRASLSEASGHPPRLSVEGYDLSFATPPGAAPFALESAAEVHLHTKAGPDDQGAAYIEVDGARTRLPGLIGRIAEGRSASLIIDGIFSGAHALVGRDWPAAMRSWSAASGAFTIRRLRVTAGSAELDSRAGSLDIGTDGRLRGTVDLTLREAPRTLDAMSQEGALPSDTARSATTVVTAVQRGPIASLPLRFEAGRATLGPGLPWARAQDLLTASVPRRQWPP